MKFNEIPNRLGLSKSQILTNLNEIKKTSKQNMTPYWNGQRFNITDIEQRIMMQYDLNREVVFFQRCVYYFRFRHSSVLVKFSNRSLECCR